ncbi:hypothetical protein SAMN05216177_110204 [Ectopseudomonas toyotomiensis]|jgi:hypothetical protein|uniref:Uncharacterized protein n=1 Tax=Ectopseudomonas toyotomiensis TaxID=554344 RepID=A0A1I5XFE5_9GAMM|nr:hypothetical protein SAMN05216177_110204 [Pseudomonas toyotomiensis]
MIDPGSIEVMLTNQVRAKREMLRCSRLPKALY